MAIAYVRAVSDSVDSANSSFVFDLTTGAAENNVLVAFIVKDANESITAPAGWTTDEDLLTNNLARVGVYHLACGASEPSTYTWTGPSARKWAGGIVEISGADLVTPINISDISGGLDAAPISPTITTTDNGCIIIAGYGVNNLNSSKSIDVSLTQRFTQNTSGGSAVGIIGGTVTQPTAGATGTYTHSSDSNAWAAFTVAVAPASSSAPSFSTDPSGSFGSKVGQTYSGSTIDANAWFTSSGGTLDTWVGTTLPSGLSIDGVTGYITGTLSQAAGNFAATVTVSDDNGTTPGNFTWDIANYSLDFTGTTRLEDTGGSPYSGTVSFAAYAGTIDGAGLSGSPIFWASQTVTDGVISLAHASLTSGTWTVFAQDDTTTTILGCYEITAA